MTVYYSATTRGFYDSSLNPKLPPDAKEVTAAAYTALLTAQGTGKLIQADATGAPEAVSPPVPAVTAASALAGLARVYAVAEAAGVSFQASGASAVSVFPSDNNGQLKLVSAFTMASAGLWADGTPWLTTAGVGVPFTKEDVVALATKVSGYVAACSTRYAALVAAVQADPAAETTDGWPSNT